MSEISEHMSATWALAVLQDAVDGILTINDQGIVLWMNPAAETLFGYAAAQVVGQNVKMLMSPPDRNRHDSYIAKYVKTGERKVIGIGREVNGLRSDGSSFPMYLSVCESNISGSRVFGGIVRDLTRRKQAEDQRHAYEEKLRSLTEELITSEERERRELAVELHDQIGQTLALAKIKLGALREAAPADIAASVTEVRDLVDQAVRSSRSLLMELGATVLNELGLEAALAALVDELRERDGIICKFDHDTGDKVIAKQLEIVLFRAARELLVNVVKHAAARHVEMVLEHHGSMLCLRITDDGAGFIVPRDGFHASKEGGFGLFSIQERLARLGGSMIVTSSPEAGTTVTLEAPMDRSSGVEDSP